MFLQRAKEKTKNSDTLIENFKDTLHNVDWGDICSGADNNENVSSLYSLFVDRFSTVFEDHFPLKITKFLKRSSPRHEWITSSLVKCCNKKSKLYKHFIITNSPLAKEKYTKYRNQLKTILEKTRQTYYDNKFKAVSQNMYKTWKILKAVLNKDGYVKPVSNFIKDGSIISCPKAIVDNFNEYFVSIGSKLARDIPESNKKFSSYLKNSPSHSLSFYLTDKFEVISIVNGLNNKFSFGCDNIPVDVVKKCATAIAEPLAALINCSFRTGLFPDRLKIAKVCPIFKSGSVNVFSDYRPISILPSFSKVFEKAAYNRLSSFLSSNNILTSCQYGFRRNHSTYMALMDLYSKASESIENNCFALGIFIDLSKAFDTINHNILCNKLQFYGVRGIALEWFKDYLSNRSQCVSFADVMSTVKILHVGCLWGRY